MNSVSTTNSLPGGGALGSVDLQSATAALGDFSNFNKSEQLLNHANNQLNFDKKAIEDDKWQ